jgi:exosome complex exonuclease DIS3/RRP44
MQTVRASDGNRTFRVLDVTHVHIEVVEPQPNRPKLQLTLVS